MSKRPRKYPLAMTTDTKAAVGKARGVLKKMTPKEFLDEARPLKESRGDRQVINNFKRDIKSGDPLGPLKFYKDGTEDGRHRAVAAKELGVLSVPVIDKRKGRKGGGRLLEDQFPTHYLPNVGRQVMADGGVPGEDASKFVRGQLSMPTAEEQARINEILHPSPLVDQYRGYGAEQAVAQNVARPMPTASEFVQHQLRGNEPQLPQMDREAVKNWEEGAKGLAHLGAYGVPVLGEGLAAYDMVNAARDIASPEFRKAMQSGDDLSVAGSLGNLAMSAFGAPGKMAKGAAAVGAAAAGMTPDEAKASFFSEAAHMSPAIRKALEAAKNAISKGDEPFDTWHKYGWAPDPSGKVVSELSDVGARLIPEGLERFRRGEGVFLGEILSHPELYDLYPKSASRSILPFDEDITNRGYYNPMRDIIGANVKLSDRDLLENLLHEHQHRIQHIEQMSPGTNPEVMLGPEEIARPFIDQRSAIQGAIELQRIMNANPRMNEIDALMHAKEKGIPIAHGALEHVRKPYENLLDDMNKATAEIEDIREKTPSKYDQYFRSLGEWTARLPGERLEMTEGQRRAAYPFPENFPVIVRPPSSNILDNPRMAGWEADRERAIDLAKRLQQEPLPPKFGIQPEKDWELEEDLMKIVQEMEARKRAGSPNPFGPVEPPTIRKGGGGLITKALGKLLPAGSGYVPRKGFTANVNLPGFGSVEARPIEPIESVSRRFAGAEHDAPVTPINPEFAERIAREYEGMRHAPKDPVVRRAYDALAQETLDQYRAAKDLGLDIKFLKPGQADPYAASPALGYEDIVNRGRMFVFPTEQGFGTTGGIDPTNVLLKGAGRIGDKEDAVVNDAFRVIHDLYGHFGPGNPFFRAPGEERAYQLHSRMFSPEARPALTSETRGQNSWVNFGPMAERNRLATGETTHYADQKTGLLPEWTMRAPPPEGADIERYIREGKAGGGNVSAALKAIVPYVERMAPMHQLSVENLKKVRDLGALPMPSIGIGKPATEPLSFGNITLVGRQHLAEPGADNPVFGQDVWSPRVPRVLNYNHKDFSGPGFYSLASNKDVPATIENIIAHMKKLPTIGGEYLTMTGDPDPTDIGYITSRFAPRFKSFEDVVGARGRVVPQWDWLEKAEALEKQHDKIRDMLEPRSTYTGSLDPEEGGTQHLGQYLLARQREEEIPWGRKTSHLYYPGMTPEETFALEQHVQSIKDMPAKYFEAKPSRPVKLEEFAGAVVPTTQMGEAEPILKQMGVEKIVPYEGFLQKPGTTVLEHFPEHHFASGGVVPRADDEQFFRRLALWTYAVGPLFSGPSRLGRQHLEKGGVSKLVKEAVKAPAVKRAIDELFPGASKRYAEVAEPVPAFDPKTGKEYLEKTLSPEGELVLKARQVAQKAINKGDYKPFFDPGARFDVDVKGYAPYQETTGIRRVQPATIEKYEAHARSPEAVERLMGAYDVGLNQAANAGDWYHMGQLEKEFINAFGPERGREMFKERFADAMAATTGGADPTTNLMMAHYGNYLKGRGETVPEASYDFPFPIGGRFAKSNMDQFRKMIMEARGITPENPKRYNFSYNFLGEPRGATIDEQMSGLYDPKMSMPPTGTYGHYEGALADLAAQRGVDPRYFQEVAWAGGKNIKTGGRYQAQPMIQNVNEAIERTSRITGLTPAQVVERGLVHAEMPLYSKGGSVIDRALDVVSSLPRDEVEPGTPG